MGRPIKQGIDYFPLDVGFFSDVKIRKIARACGPNAASILICLLCNIYRDNGYYIGWDEDLPFFIADEVGVSEGCVKEILTKAVQVGFFDKDMYEKHNILTSAGIQKRFFDITRQRKEIEINNDFLLDFGKNGVNHVKKPINHVKNSVNTIDNRQRKEKESKEKGSNIPPLSPPCGESAEAAKNWRDDFEVYKSELKEAFYKILSDKGFIENRQKYHPNLDIRMSLQKAYEDYWCTEAGWKKKKSSRTKEIDWPATFRKALDQPQNRVYKQKGASEPEPERAMSELQERFARFLRKEAPLLLDMPLQPSDEEVGVLLKIRKEILLDIVKKINNDKYLTTRKNSVFQTIMELKQKEYGTP